MRKIVAVLLSLSLLGLAAITPRDAESAGGRSVAFIYDRPGGFNGMVCALTVDKNGVMTAVPGSPFDTNNPTVNVCSFDAPCQSLGYSPKKDLLFVAGGQGISVFRVPKSGILTLVPGSPFGTTVDTFGFIGLTVSEQRKRVFVYATESLQNQIRGFECFNGTLVELPGSPFPAGLGPVGIDAAKKCLCVMNFFDGTLSSYQIAANGSLAPAPGSPVAVTGGSDAITCSMDLKGKAVYVGDQGAAQVHAFAVNKKTCALTAVPGSPFAAAVQPGQQLAVSKKLVMAIAPFNQPSAFAAFKAKKGVLTALGGAQATVLPGGSTGAAFDPKGKVLLAVGPLDFQVASYKVGKTGGLTPVDVDPIALTQFEDIIIVKP